MLQSLDPQAEAEQQLRSIKVIVKVTELPQNTKNCGYISAKKQKNNRRDQKAEEAPGEQ